MADAPRANASLLVPIDAAMGEAVWPLASARASPDRVIIPLFATAGFLPYLKNVLCSLRRVRLEHWIVVAMDNATCPALHDAMGEATGAACIHPYARLPPAQTAPSDATGPAAYRSSRFNWIVMQRPIWVRWFLSRGLTVLQCDLDLVFLHDPLPDLLTGRADIQFQSEQVYGSNGGFYFARPTAAAFKLFDAWLGVLAATAGTRGFEEQHALNGALPSARGHTSKLNETRYPNGKIWWQYQRSTKADAYVVHCNWVKFNKKTRLRRGPTIRVDPAECAPLAARDEAGVPALAWPMRSRAVTFVAQAR